MLAEELGLRVFRPVVLSLACSFTGLGLQGFRV